MKTATVLALSLVLCNVHPVVAKKESQMNGKTFHTVEFQGGKNWKKDLPPEKQDLSGHFARNQTDFDHGTLIANGPLLETFHGFYVYDIADGDKVRAQVSGDYGITNGVLALVEIQPWQVLIDHSQTDTAGMDLFVLDYVAGANYLGGKRMDQQDSKVMGAHLAYVSGKATAATVILGGPVAPAVGRGRYIVAARSKDEAQRFVAEDPAIVAGVFTAAIKTWKPFQKQATRR